MPAEYEPTADQRALVESAAAFGLTQADIAQQLKIDEKTLRKHFRDELSGGKFKIDMSAGKTLVEDEVQRRARPPRSDEILHRPAHGLERDHGAASDRRRQWPCEI
jgi:hypothetical protein